MTARAAPRFAPAAPFRPGDADLLTMRRKVQVARKQLGLAEDDYRAILMRVTGFDSSTKCGPSHLDELLREFKRLGWKPTTTAANGRKPLSAKAQIRMIHAVFADFRQHLAVGDDSTLRAFVARQTKTEANPAGVSAPEFLDAVQANKVLEGLKAWRRRTLALVAEIKGGGR
jgi:phage gp16-like protein